MLSTLLILVPGSVISYYIYERCCEDNEHKLEKKLKKLTSEEKKVFVLKNVNYISSSFMRDYLHDLNLQLPMPRWNFRSVDAMQLQLQNFSDELQQRLYEKDSVDPELRYKQKLIAELYVSLRSWNSSLIDFSEVLKFMAVEMNDERENEISRQLEIINQLHEKYPKVS